VVEFVLKDLRNKFRKESPLVTSHRKVLEYLGMTIEHTSKGNARLFLDTLKNLEELPREIGVRSKMPMANLTHS